MKNKNLTFSLFRILMKNIFSMGEFFASFKKGPKQIVKNILLFLCAVYCIGAFGFLYVTSMLAYYKVFDAAGTPEVLTVVGFLYCVLIILFFGFLSSASNYYTGSGEEQFRAMPLTSKNIFGAKFAVSFITDAIFGILFCAITSIIYGYNQHLMKNPSFYIGFLVTGITIAVVCVFVIYFLLILVMTIFPALRKRNILTGISSFFIIVFAFFFSLSNSQSSVAFTDGDYQSIAPMIDLACNVYKASPALRFLASATKGNWISIIFMIAVFCLVVFVLIPAVSGLYINTLNGFSDVKTKKITKEQAEEVVQKEIKVTSVKTALYWRDVKTVFREPAFFSNGPLMVFLFPLIMIFSFGVGFAAAGDGGLNEMIQGIRDAWFSMDASMLEKVKFYIAIGSAAFATFIANCTSIAATSFSREGKSLYVLKTLPVEASDIVFVKFLHALTYVFISIVEVMIIIIAIVLFLQLPLSVAEILKITEMMAVSTIIVSLFLIYIDMFVDTANPKLTWENPIVAFKQNLNSVIAAFITMGVIAIFVAVNVVFSASTTALTVCLVVFVVADAIVGNAYFRYASKRLPTMN